MATELGGLMIKAEAEGLSNPDIAQQLFVTVITVEGHLRHIYQKLSIKSRHELPDALHPTLPGQGREPSSV